MRVVETPYMYRHPSVKYDHKNKVNVYNGNILPPELKEFETKDYSYSRWIEDDMNGTVRPPMKSPNKFSPYEHQKEAAQKIVSAYKKGDNNFLEADKTGLGKTLATLTGVCALAKINGFNRQKPAKVLIVCPKGVIPTWRKTLHSYPVSSILIRPMIIGYHYSNLNKLLEKPKNATKAKRKKTQKRVLSREGKPKIDWDYIIFDESQYLKNYPKSSLSVAAVSVARLNEPYIKGKSPFVIFSTATPGSNPLNFAVMAGVVAPYLEYPSKNVTPKTWAEHLIKNRFNIKNVKSNEYTWIRPSGPEDNTTKVLQKKDALKIGRALRSPGAPFIMRSPKDIAGWPEQQLIPLPIELDNEGYKHYETAWTVFKNWLKLAPAKKDPKAGLVVQLRYRQKVSLLKVPEMVERIREDVEDGKQVYVSCEFLETIDKYEESFDKLGIPYSEITGRKSSVQEEETLKFQKGKSKVALTNIVSGISLHAEESLVDGTKATSNERVTIIHDVRMNDLDTEQSLGRAHREGKNSLSYFPYFINTVDEKTIMSYVNKKSNMNLMTGSSIQEVEDIEDIFQQQANQDA